jgi:hypothetical protein
MGWIKNAVRWYAKPVELAPSKNGALPGVKAGRISDPQQTDLLGRVQIFNRYWQSISPTVNQTIVEFIINASFVDATLSNVRKFLKHLTATNLRFVVDERPEAETQRIFEITENFRERINLDLLVQHLIDQLLTTGAVSYEDVVAADMGGIAELAVVPAQAIRFKWEEGIWQAYQSVTASSKDVKLPGETYHYAAVETMQGAPYAIPPFIAAARHVLVAQDIDENMRFIFRKFGMLGFLHYLMEPPEGYDWQDPEQRAAFQAAIAQRATDFDQNFYKGMMVGPKDGELGVTSVSSDSRGAADLIDRVAEKEHAGGGVHGGLLGQSNRPADTFANVIYRTAVHQAGSYQMILARELGRSVRLELALAGENPDGISAEFDENSAFDPLSESQARTTEISGEMILLDRGACSIEDIAQKYFGKPAFAPERAYGQEYEGADYVPKLGKELTTETQRHRGLKVKR